MAGGCCAFIDVRRAKGRKRSGTRMAISDQKHGEVQREAAIRWPSFLDKRSQARQFRHAVALFQPVPGAFERFGSVLKRAHPSGKL